MAPSNLNDGTREQRINQVIADYLTSVEAGRPLDRQELLVRHADLADDLAAFFADHDRMREMAAPLGPAAAATLSFHPGPAETATLPPGETVGGACPRPPSSG